tara:strand:+ start:4311 stop:5132 length:822 start_codon:yes stop_codon:yes gene_type:complete
MIAIGLSAVWVMRMVSAAGISISATLIGAVLVWGVSVKLRDTSIVDIAWGPAFVVCGVVYLVMTPDLSLRSILVTSLVFGWAVRLSSHIYQANKNKPEDVRYQAFRANSGAAYWWKSLYKVFMLQGLLAFLVSAPLLLIAFHPGAEFPTIFDLAALAAWAIGAFFEFVGDRQLRAFKADASNKGKVLCSGLWAITRHPNYFGETLMWWGVYLFCLSSGWSGMLVLFSPILMTVLVRWVSGVSMLERILIKTKPGYRDYMLTTPALVPRIPWWK